jgi:hypothetical protein
MTKRKVVIVAGIVLITAISIWMGFASDPLNGIAFFFVLTGLLWTVAKTRHWI